MRFEHQTHQKIDVPEVVPVAVRVAVRVVFHGAWLMDLVWWVSLKQECGKRTEIGKYVYIFIYICAEYICSMHEHQYLAKVQKSLHNCSAFATFVHSRSPNENRGNAAMGDTVPHWPNAYSALLPFLFCPAIRQYVAS